MSTTCVSPLADLERVYNKTLAEVGLLATRKLPTARMLCSVAFDIKDHAQMSNRALAYDMNRRRL